MHCAPNALSCAAHLVREISLDEGKWPTPVGLFATHTLLSAHRGILTRTSSTFLSHAKTHAPCVWKEGLTSAVHNDKMGIGAENHSMKVWP